jgi:hypothetical protein
MEPAGQFAGQFVLGCKRIGGNFPWKKFHWHR